jgi:serine protease Do
MIENLKSSGRTWYLQALAVVALALTLNFAGLAESRADGPQSVADLADRLSPAVVNISTSQRVAGNSGVEIPELPPNAPFREFFEDFFDQQQPEDDSQRQVSSLGSGFVIDASGIIVTNNHVIEGADEIEVTFTDGTTLSAELLGTDSKTDIALLRVESEEPLVAVPLGDSTSLRVGDWVLAIGNPFGLGGTVTIGIVSGRNRDINSGPYDDFIQTDAAINRGNSGGPLFNMDGEVVGINTAIISPLPNGGSVGIGFSIPTSTAEPVIDQLAEFGETRRGWLGVRIQSVTDELAETLGLEDASGALVADVTVGGPAEEAGLAPGDVIVEFDGREVPRMRDLPRIVAETLVGREVDVLIIRDGEEVTVGVTIGRLEDGERLIASQEQEEQDAKAQEEEEAAEPLQSALGLSLSPLTDDLRTQYEISERVSGVLIIGVEDESSAADKRIQAGDVIVEVGQQPVGSPEEVVARVQELEGEGRGSVLLLLANRNGDLRFSALRFGEN